MLYSPRQLPRIDEKAFALAWDHVDGECRVLLDDRVVWREPAGRDVHLRFERIAEILRHAYAGSLKDLVPTARGEAALSGDGPESRAAVETARAAVVAGGDPGYVFFSLRDLAGAIRRGDADLVRRYLARGGDPSEREQGNDISLLHLATQLRRTEIVTMLLLAGADVNRVDYHGRSPLFEALAAPTRPGGGIGPGGGFQMPGPDPNPPAGDDEASVIVRLLLDAGARLDGLDRKLDRLEGWAAKIYSPPLAVAAKNRRNADLRLLLERGADPNLGDYGGRTALHEAAFVGNVEAVRVLLDAGADPNRVVPVNDYTPLHQAIYAPEPNPYVVRLLARGGADLEWTDSRGAPPLFAAVEHVDFLRILLEAGADVHARGPEGDGILAYAVRRAATRQLHPSVMVPPVELLLAAGADRAARTSDGKTARDLARERGWESLEALL